ncbi:DUF7925 domain-containing protein [Leptothoe kymatousa]|uniref:DUF7925 domain-containing protein n=1 Tax=Leptothoe kymatousa TAU-MAC 1615 TaxID=2364775 RepID=A0ABS5Y0D7_9CYAN|nr:hypothetical protein [Leptothoe kymatousa]MBT9311299.1 hypothetical protein [Leptothoe kymatousa TAU-MAC 1615]
MTKNKNSKGLSWQLCKPVIASALAIGGVFNMVSLVLADGTAAGTKITNTATATYRDPEGTPQTSTSNTVEVEVAEIAGITVVNTSVQNETTPGAAVEPGDQVEFIFEVTNVGNDETDISLPAIANFSGPVDSVVSIVADLNNDGNFDPATETITSRTDFENLAPGDSFDVQVIIQTSTSAQDDDVITVQYGDTPGDGQNQPYDSSGGSVFTDDNDSPADGTAAEAGPEAPTNGEREASDTGDVTVGLEPLKQPLVTLEKEFSNHNPGANTTSPIDDQLTYDLDFTVGTTVPTGSTAEAADLQPISINVDGADVRHVLISDALPADTSLVSHTSADGTWTPVYTESAVTINALEAQWSTGTPTANTTRVGFIKTANTSIARGTTVTGFEIVVEASGYAGQTPFTIANIAQIFGSGVEDDPLTPEDESLTFPVMDESGDQTPSDYDPTTDTYSSFNPDIVDDPTTDLPEGFTPDDGYIDDPSDLITTGVSDKVTNDDPTDPENLDIGTVDPSDDNPTTPEDGGGEAIVVELEPEPISDLLNGPDGSADAVGPTGTNDDFTNKSAPYSDGDPPVVSFTNTVDSSSTEDGWVRLEPIAPPTNTDLPDETTATIIAPDGTRVEYEYDQPTGTWSKTNPTDPDIIVPVRADDGVPGGDDEFDYGVEVDLPNNPTEITELDSFPVPIEATFAGVTDVQNEDVNNGGNDGIDTTDITNVLDTSDIQNTTIDRIYTGFLELVKTAQVVQGDGPPVSGNPAPGNHIRYRVTYNNISEPEVAPMQGNVVLTASDLAIIEDGTEKGCSLAVTDANNWAFDNDANTELDTRHVPSAVDLTNLDAGSTGSVVFFNGGPVCDGGGTTGNPDFNPDTTTPSAELSGTTYNTDSTKYVFDIQGDIDPLETGYVEFERRIN